MPNMLFNKRPNDVFVSYAHGDLASVEPLVKWLQNSAGVRVWYDTDSLNPGRRLGTALPEGLGSARAALFCVSQSWIASSWCEEEFNAALQERRADRRYRIIALHLDDSRVPTFLANSRYLEMRSLEAEAGVTLLRALVPEPAPWSHSDRDVYLARSWHPGDAEAADRVCIALSRDCGFRLVGDSPDYPAFDGEHRIRRTIESCGALVAVLPFREDPSNGFTSKWIVNEIELARGVDRPYLLFAADGVKLADDLVQAAFGGYLHQLPKSAEDAELLSILLRFEEEAYRPTPRPAYAFFATSLREVEETDRLIGLVEQVTAMPCLLGQRLRAQHAQQEIIERIRDAEFVIADVSDNHNNSLIEAGIARGAGRRLHLICKATGPERRTRFMFRDLEIGWYDDPVDRIGVMHRVAQMYRRRIFHTLAAV